MSQFIVKTYPIRPAPGKRQPERQFTAVLLSDLHDCELGTDNMDLLKAIRKVRPELILSAGDLLTSGKVCEMDHAMSLLRSLCCEYPVYAVNGNHEQRLKNNRGLYGNAYQEYEEQMKEMGVRLLVNESRSLTVCQMPLEIWGLELPPHCYMKWKRPVLELSEMEELLGQPQSGPFHILLAHNPGYFSTYAAWNADLVLSGHYHGGIIRVPLIGAVINPQFQLFPKYSHGLYTEKNCRMIVSSGLGWHTIPLRINNPAELVVLRFTPEQ